MKIGVLSQWFDPETGPAAIPGVFAREFVRSGHEVSVLTGFPNYPEGRLYPGYRQRLRGVSSADGIQVTRVPLYPSHSASSLGRALNYASFAGSATVLGGSAFREVDAVWVYNSPVSVSFPLFRHTRRGRVPYFLHVQDVWPESLMESGMFPSGTIGRSVARMIRRIVRATENHSAVVGVISPSVRDLIMSRNPTIDPAKIIYVPNPTDEELFQPVSNFPVAVDAMREDVFTVMYVGAIGDVQGLDTVLDAARILLSRSDLRFSIVGDGIARERLEREAQDRGLKNIVFHGRIAKELVPETMSTADAQLVSLANSEFLRHTTPSKISSLLASEVPVIGLIAGDGAQLLKDSGAALVVEPGDAEALADAVTRMADMPADERQRMAKSGRSYYIAHLSAAVTGARVVNALKGALRHE